MIKAIETTYKGYRMRSRTEARWACFFDALGIDWTYEPEGYDLGEAGWYLPDFWLPLPTIKYPNAGYFVEIKGVKPLDSYLVKLCTLSVQSNHGVWCFVGEPGKQLLFKAQNSGDASWLLNESPQNMRLDPFVFSLWSTFSRFWTCHVEKQSIAPGFDKFEKAINAARSAQFEHGRSGIR